MGQKKFANGFILGMALTLAVGGAGMKVYDVVEDRQNSKNAVNDESMEKAKLIEEIIDEILEKWIRNSWKQTCIRA